MADGFRCKPPLYLNHRKRLTTGIHQNQHPRPERHRPVNITPVETFVGWRETNLGRGKSPRTPTAILAIHHPVVRRIQFPHHGVCQLTTFITSGRRISSYSCALMVCNTFRVSSVSSRYLPCCRPSPAGRCGCLSGGISRVIGAFSGIRLRGCGAHPAVAPSSCLSYGALHVQPHHLSSSSASRAAPDSPASFRAAIICGFSGVRRSLLLSAATSRACGIR